MKVNFRSPGTKSLGNESSP